MEVIEINTKKYYTFEKIKEIKHASTVKCTQTHQKYIDKNNLVANQDYIYARLIENKWIETTNKTRSKKEDKLFITKEWIDSFDTIKDPVRIAPKIINLSDIEWCKDRDGNIFQIEIRGERTPKGAYFKASDLSTPFGVDRYSETIAHANSGYIKGEDYVIFQVTRPNGTVTNTKNEIFLTMNGLIVGITRARKNSAGAYLFKWIVNVFFCGLIGTPEQKNKVVTKILGKSCDEMKKNLSCLTGPVAAIYLIRLGNVSDCKDIFSIKDHPDSSGVYKAGKASDIIERLQQHARGYQERRVTDILIQACFVVDYVLLSEAETSVLEYFGNKNMRLRGGNDKEIVIFPDKKLSQIKKDLKQRMERFVPNKSNGTWIIDKLKKKVSKMKKIHELEMSNVHLSYQAQILQLQSENEQLKQAIIHKEELYEKEMALKEIRRKYSNKLASV